MKEFDGISGRKPNRLSEYDYSTPGYYFVTICTQHHIHRLAIISDSQVHLSKEGQICLDVWKTLPDWFDCVELDEFVIMPNHIHGILTIKDQQETRSLSTIIGTFKSSVSRRYTVWCRDNQHKQKGVIWQRSFHDHVIRNERALFAIRQYIRYNPMNWEKDPENM